MLRRLGERCGAGAHCDPAVSGRLDGKDRATVDHMPPLERLGMPADIAEVVSCQFCTVGRIVMSPISTSCGCSIANATASATASGASPNVAAMPVFARQNRGHFVTTVSTAGLKIVPDMGVYDALTLLGDVRHIAV